MSYRVQSSDNLNARVDDASAARAEITDTAKAAIAKAEELIADNPVAAIGLALALGVAVGWIVKRW